MPDDETTRPKPREFFIQPPLVLRPVARIAKAVAREDSTSIEEEIVVEEQRVPRMRTLKQLVADLEEFARQT